MSADQEQEQPSVSYESNKNEETPFVNKLIDENTSLKQQILSLSAELRCLKVKPGSVENFTEEIEALSSAIKSIRAAADAENIETARRKVTATVDLHIQNQNENSDLPTSSPSSPATRIQSLENSMLSETERKALKLQRERIKKSIEDNLGGADRIDQLVEDELQKRRREKLSRQLEQESFARGANVLNISSSSSSVGRNINNNSLLSSSTSYSPSPLTTSTKTTASNTNNNDTMMAISPVRVPRKPLPTDEEYKQMIAEEDKILSAQREENNRRIAQEEAERNETLVSVLSNPRDYSISREREEKQQMIIGNSTPLRSALVKAQQDAFNLLKRDLENNTSETTASGGQSGEEEYRQKIQQRLLALQDLEKHHQEMIQRGNCAAAALSV